MGHHGGWHGGHGGGGLSLPGLPALPGPPGLPGLPALPGPQVNFRVGGGYPMWGHGYYHRGYYPTTIIIGGRQPAPQPVYQPVYYGGGQPQYGGGGGNFMGNLLKGGMMTALIGAVIGFMIGGPVGALLGGVLGMMGTEGLGGIASGFGDMFGKVKNMFTGGGSSSSRSPQQQQAPQLSLMDSQATPDYQRSAPPADIMPPLPTPSVGLESAATRTQ